MKRIIDGATYNTETATLVAEGLQESDGTRTAIALYQSAAGVFFNVDTVSTSYRDRHLQWQERTSYDWHIVGDPAAARQWCEEWGLTIIREIEDMPPEATPGEKMATLYIRLPPSLKSAIEARAAGQGTSVNVFALRCLEGCVRHDVPTLDVVAYLKSLGLVPVARNGQQSVSWCRSTTTPPLFYVSDKDNTVVLAMGHEAVPSLHKDASFRASILKELQELGLRNTGDLWPTVALKYLDTEAKQEAFRGIMSKVLAKASEDTSAAPV